jgi:protein TonB
MSKQTVTQDPLPLYALEEKTDARNRRIALVAAALFHIALLAVHLPSRTAEAAEPEKREVITVLKAIRFEPPPPPKPEEIRKPRATRVPVPDPTPDEPEPIRQAEVLEADLDLNPDPIIELPSEAPPVLPDTPLRLGGEIKMPARVHYVAPQYTEAARRVRTQGVVIIEATIDKQGHVVDATLLRPLPMGLDAEALKAVKQWRYEPATLNGRPVSIYATVTVLFELN